MEATSKMNLERNSNIELWRCCCMFAVVLGHVLVNNHICTMNGYMWHIPGFLLISGYFGIKFSFSKLAKLLSVAYVLYWITIPLRPWTGFSSLLVPHGGWFLPFYCVLMLMSPLLNAALENGKTNRIVLLTTVAMVLIGWIPTFSDNAHIQMIAIPGMQGNGLLLMIATYIIGAVLRIYEVSKYFGYFSWFAFFVFGILGCVCLGMWVPTSCHYLSPISIATASCGLMFFLSMPSLPVSIGRVVNYISPSMFGVYILHENCVRKFQYMVSVGGGGLLDAVFLATWLFYGCILIDVIRRMLIKGFNSLWRKIF